MFPLSPADFLDYRAQNRVFQDIATYVRQDQQYGGERPERLTGVRVSHGFFRLFGFEPMLGRAFTRAEEANSGPTDVAIISYNVWHRLLGGDPHVIGKTIRLTDYPFRIVGVMPAGFEHVGGGYRLPRGDDRWTCGCRSICWAIPRACRARFTTATPWPGSSPGSRSSRRRRR